VRNSHSPGAWQRPNDWAKHHSSLDLLGGVVLAVVFVALFARRLAFVLQVVIAVTFVLGSYGLARLNRGR
jgi:hypothetical protein